MKKELLDFSKMDLETWLIETEKLGLSEDELFNHINEQDTCPNHLYEKISDKYNIKTVGSVKNILFALWNPMAQKNDLYTEITAYKLADGSIVESKEEAESKAKEIKIKNDLYHSFSTEYADFIFEHIERIRKIINQ